jgi:hypothetical protein
MTRLVAKGYNQIEGLDFFNTSRVDNNFNIKDLGILKLKSILFLLVISYPKSLTMYMSFHFYGVEENPFIYD